MRTSWILIAPVLCGRCASADFGGDQAVEQVQLVVLEADVQHVGLAAGGDVARHLERHRGLAGALGAADQQQLAGAEAGPDRLVEGREAERHGLVLADLARRHLVVEVDEHIDAPTGAPCSRSDRRGATWPSGPPLLPSSRAFRSSAKAIAVGCILAPGFRRTVTRDGAGDDPNVLPGVPVLSPPWRRPDRSRRRPRARPTAAR